MLIENRQFFLNSIILLVCLENLIPVSGLVFTTLCLINKNLCPNKNITLTSLLPFPQTLQVLTNIGRKPDYARRANLNLRPQAELDGKNEDKEADANIEQAPLISKEDYATPYPPKANLPADLEKQGLPLLPKKEDKLPVDSEGIKPEAASKEKEAVPSKLKLPADPDKEKQPLNSEKKDVAANTKGKEPVAGSQEKEAVASPGKGYSVVPQNEEGDSGEKKVIPKSIQDQVLVDPEKNEPTNAPKKLPEQEEKDGIKEPLKAADQAELFRKLPNGAIHVKPPNNATD